MGMSQPLSELLLSQPEILWNFKLSGGSLTLYPSWLTLGSPPSGVCPGAISKAFPDLPHENHLLPHPLCAFL